MNLIPLTDTTVCIEQDTLLSLLDEKITALGWIWGSGEDRFGFWCEIYTPKETKLLRAPSLKEVLLLAFHTVTA